MWNQLIERLLWPALLAGISGLTISIVVHFALIFGFDPKTFRTAVVPLHLGAILVPIAALVLLRRLVGRSFFGPGEIWTLLRHAFPAWLLALAGVGFVYLFTSPF